MPGRGRFEDELYNFTIVEVPSWVLLVAERAKAMGIYTPELMIRLIFLQRYNGEVMFVHDR